MNINGKVSSLGMAAAGFSMLFSNNAFAGAVRCEVVMDIIGSADTAGPVILAHQVSGANCPGWGTRPSNNFLIMEPTQNACLAVALTAESLNRTIYLHSLDDTFGDWKTMHQCYVGKPK